MGPPQGKNGFLTCPGGSRSPLTLVQADGRGPRMVGPRWGLPRAANLQIKLWPPFLPILLYLSLPTPTLHIVCVSLSDPLVLYPFLILMVITSWLQYGGCTSRHHTRIPGTMTRQKELIDASKHFPGYLWWRHKLVSV